jgi:hypothetical protein
MNLAIPYGGPARASYRRPVAFDPVSRLYARTCIVVTTNLAFIDNTIAQTTDTITVRAALCFNGRCYCSRTDRRRVRHSLA